MSVRAPIPAAADSAPLRLATFGGCTLIHPLAALRHSDEAVVVHKDIGFRHNPLTMSSGGALQLLRVILGETDLPPVVRRMSYGEPDFVVNPAKGPTLADADLYIIEMTTPIELRYDGYIVNQNRYREEVLDVFRARPDLKRPANLWNGHGLLKCDEAVRATRAQELLALLDPASEEDRFLIDIVEKTRAHFTTEDDMYRDLMAFRERLDIPGMVALHTFSYMPDGRPISWPEGFREMQENAARRAGFPTFDPAPIVLAAGAEKIMEEDLRHYDKAYLPEVGRHIMDSIGAAFPDLAARMHRTA